MRTLVIVKPEVRRQALPRFAGTGIVVQIHFLILDRPPQAFRKDVVQRPPATIHADLYVRGLEPVNVRGTRKLTALIAVPDRGGVLKSRNILPRLLIPVQDNALS